VTAPPHHVPHPVPPPAVPVRRRRQFVLLLAAVVAALTVGLVIDLLRQRSAAPIAVWHAPATLAPASDRPTLLRFTADWCPPCRAMDRDVFSLPRIADTLGTRFHAVSVDLTDPGPDEQSLADRHGISSIPSFVVLDPGGAEAGRLVGGVDADRFTAFLKRWPNPWPDRHPDHPAP